MGFKMIDELKTHMIYFIPPFGVLNEGSRKMSLSNLIICFLQENQEIETRQINLQRHEHNEVLFMSILCKYT